MGQCPDAVKRLIEHFDRQSDQVRSAEYNETQLRIDFINPMFRELGWDMDNAQGFSEQYREVVHEDRVKVAGATKAPDYSFRIGGVRKFFLEAKKPFVNIKTNPEPAYQLRRYAWSAKLAISLLTDFEELAIYDCRIAPKHLEKPAVARREFIGYREFADRWDFLEGTLSKRAVLTGEFDRYCATKKGRGAQEFDEAFLEEIENWRRTLANNLALRNDDLDEHGLNFAVQRIIDRIIFLRICEDRGVEPVGHLQQLLGGDETYERLLKLFRDADDRYNSGIFHFKREKDRPESPDELTPALTVDDVRLKSILRRLYYPESPYEFTVVSADILGSVYERFLGKVISLTPGHRAKIEEKPEVRKAGGVYYTPTYIVDYIVKQTVGRLLAPVGVAAEGDAGVAPTFATPKEAAKLKILDPACGSGSFLLGAYQYLLDWHLKWYVADGPERWSKGKSTTIRPADKPSVLAASAEEAGALRDPAAGLGHWALTTRERKRILLENIHGVDIDYQAVEVTKLSLLLKCLEGETAGSLRSQLMMFHERALPDLGRNIQCGNSLIGTDIMSTDAWREMSEEQRRKINPFDFERAFPQVFTQGGFDAVIGNPPWGQKDIEKDPPIEKYLRSRFGSLAGIFDLFRPFVELATSLTRSGGSIGQVLPDIVLLKDYESTRRLLLETTALCRIDWWGMAFQDAVIDATTMIAQHAPAGKNHRVAVTIHEDNRHDQLELRQADFAMNPRATFNLILTDERRAIIERLNCLPRLADFFEVHEGVHSGNIRAELFVDSLIDPSCHELIFGRDEIVPFRLRWDGKYIRLSAVPANRTSIRYANVGQRQWHEAQKVLVRRTGDRVTAAVDRVGRYCSNNFFLALCSRPHPLDLDGLCALLNSRFMTAYFRLIEPRKGRVFSELKIKHLGQFPLPASSSEQRALAMNALGRKRMELQLRVEATTVPAEHERLSREINYLDEAIDNTTCSLLGIDLQDWVHLRDLVEEWTWPKDHHQLNIVA